MNRIVKGLIWTTVLIGLAFFFSYKILEAPLGLTSDEGGFGINAVHLSRNLRDENGILLPVFALSLNGKEWRQPVTQYYLAGFFKLFGANVFNLRFSTVIITLICAVLMYLLGKEFFSKKWAIFCVAIFLTTPLIMIQTHLALDNIMPVPFTIFWLWMITLYHKKPSAKYLLWAGVSLGIGFYTYKGMRATVPVWIILTSLYLTLRHKVGVFRAIIPFALGLAPFFLPIPYLEKRYPGAVFDNKGYNWDSWYKFLLPYLSSFDLAFLFIEGDATPYHSTGIHGMFLLASLPLFLIGIYQSIQKRNFQLFILTVFFTTPLLFGFVNSIHRASRLMSMIPAFTIIATFGAKLLWEKKKIMLVVVGILLILNFGDFANYYWNKYPELTRNVFGDLSVYKDYVAFAKEAEELHLEPYMESTIPEHEGFSGEFFQLSYLADDMRYISDWENLPEGAIFLSVREEIPGLQKLPVKTVKYHILVNKRI